MPRLTDSVAFIFPAIHTGCVVLRFWQCCCYSPEFVALDTSTDLSNIVCQLQGSSIYVISTNEVLTYAIHTGCEQRFWQWFCYSPEFVALYTMLWFVSNYRGSHSYVIIVNAVPTYVLVVDSYESLKGLECWIWNGLFHHHLNSYADSVICNCANFYLQKLSYWSLCLIL